MNEAQVRTVEQVRQVLEGTQALEFEQAQDDDEQLPRVQRLLDAVNERPAAQRPAALKERHAFKAEMDDEARRAMFPAERAAEGLISAAALDELFDAATEFPPGWVANGRPNHPVGSTRLRPI